MTLLISTLAFIVSMTVYYVSEKARTLKVNSLCYMFGGASLMWLVDAVVEFFTALAEAKSDGVIWTEAVEEVFTPTVQDAFLGLSVVALAMLVWLAIVAIKDPLGVFKKKK